MTCRISVIGSFFQYDNLDIRPGDWQMPCGTSVENTKVRIEKVRGILSCSGTMYSDRVVCFEIDKNCNVYSVNCYP